MLPTVLIRAPQTSSEFEAYFLLRYELLRKPWHQPKGSERDEEEEHCTHIMACGPDGIVVGVCRLQLHSPSEARLRYMAVKEKVQGLGVGKKMIAYAEGKAREMGAGRIMLQARENAVAFYKKCGYSVAEKSHLMWGQIQHYKMEKNL